LLGLSLPMALAQGGGDVARVELRGAHRTRPTTLLELLPRPPPAVYTDAELSEFERRVGNLAIFDMVEVTLRDAVLEVRVKEKWTLVPEVDFSTGTTLADTYALVGLTEYNLLGLGSALGFNVYRERRGFGFMTRYDEHVYRRTRWSRSVEVGYGSVELRFPSAAGWCKNEARAGLWLTSPPILTDALRYEFGMMYARETYDDVQGPVRPRAGHYLALPIMFTWDAYRWHDLTPQGWALTLNLTPGVFVGPDLAQPRHSAESTLKGAVAITRTTALMGKAVAALTVRGNANHNLPLGSVQGIRGLEDGWYFNWAQVVVNVELRQAVPLPGRWALQGVLFADTGGFEQLDVHGRRADAHAAFSGGAGVRVIPTWLTGVVLRFDVARLVRPERLLMHQFGVSQYF
jgi:hypothetical protein